MDDRTTGALLGMIAGDAYVYSAKRLQSGKYPYIASGMRVVHGTQQRAYCEFKCALVNKLLGCSSSVRAIKNGPDRKHDAVHFTVSNSYFRLLRRWCYPEGKKAFNQLWLDHMTPEGVALWYMDDGHARRNYNKDGRVTSVSTSIATCCPEPEAELVCRWFRDEHKIRFTPFKDGRFWSVRVNTEESRQFAHLVQPYIIEPMLYKLAHVADLNSHECRAPFGKCVECSATIYDNRRKGLCHACYARRYYRQVIRARRNGDDIVRPTRKLVEVVDKEPPR